MAGPKSAAEPILIDLNNPSDEAIAQLRERGAPRSSQKAAGTSTKSGTSKRERKGTLIEEIPDGQSIDDVFEAQDGEHHEEEEDEDDFQLTPFQEEVIEAVLVPRRCFLHTSERRADARLLYPVGCTWMLLLCRIRHCSARTICTTYHHSQRARARG